MHLYINYEYWDEFYAFCLEIFGNCEPEIDSHENKSTYDTDDDDKNHKHKKKTSSYIYKIYNVINRITRTKIQCVIIKNIHEYKLKDFTCTRNYFRGNDLIVHSLKEIRDRVIYIHKNDIMNLNDHDGKKLSFYYRWAKYVGKGFKTYIMGENITLNIHISIYDTSLYNKLDKLRDMGVLKNDLIQMHRFEIINPHDISYTI